MLHTQSCVSPLTSTRSRCDDWKVWHSKQRRAGCVLASDLEKKKKKTRRVASTNSGNKISDFICPFPCQNHRFLCDAFLADLKISIDLFISTPLLLHHDQIIDASRAHETHGAAPRAAPGRSRCVGKSGPKPIIYATRYMETDGNGKISHTLCQSCFPLEQTAKISFLSCQLVA